MGRITYKKKRMYFIKRFLNISINILFGLLCVTIIGIIYICFRSLFVYVFTMDNYIGDIIAIIFSVIMFLLPLISKIRNFVFICLNKVKQNLYIYLCTHKITLLSKGILNYNVNKLGYSPIQMSIITKAIDILKNKKQGIFAIESLPYRGKTTAAMLLLDFIGRDNKLIDLFTSLQNKILYFDGAINIEDTLDFLDNSDLLSDSIIIIDNIHKITSSKLPELINRTIMCINYLISVNKSCLILLMYQLSQTNKSLMSEINRIRNQNQYNIQFLLQEDIKSIHKNVLNEKIKINIQNICNIISEDSHILKQHLLFLVKIQENNTLFSIIDNYILNKKSILSGKKLQKKINIIIASVLIASFYGYIHKKYLILIGSIFNYRKITTKKILTFLKKEGFLIDFPLIPSTYLFNEKLANQYKQILLSNIIFKKIYFQCAEALFKYENINSTTAWMYFIACSAKYCRELNIEERNQLFYRCCDEYSVIYLIDTLEIEFLIEPEKIMIFSKEIGTLYIQNGQWAKAREILKPLIEDKNNQEETWALQLQIIEADHGVDDAKNYLLLNQIIEKSTVAYTVFQAKYWKYHISMEQGNFVLNKLMELCEDIKQYPDWEKHENYWHIIRRLNSDCARTYFLNGIIDFDIFQNIISLMNNYNVEKETYDYSCQKIILSKAHYIHYDIIYQLGLWGYYRYSKIDPQIDEKNISILVENAMNIYDECINIYKAEGDKKWRTLQVRRDELSLCLDTCDYIEILKNLDNFQEYAEKNKINVFEGYCETLRGKTFALYAISVLTQGDVVKYDKYILNSLEQLKKAQNHYKNYGNEYGLMRAELLYTFVSMLEKRSNNTVIKTVSFQKNYTTILIGFLNKYSINNRYNRENDIIEFLLSNIKELSSVICTLKYYPVVLQ